MKNYVAPCYTWWHCDAVLKCKFNRGFCELKYLEYFRCVPMPYCTTAAPTSTTQLIFNYFISWYYQHRLYHRLASSDLNISINSILDFDKKWFLYNWKIIRKYSFSHKHFEQKIDTKTELPIEAKYVILYAK